MKLQIFIKKQIKKVKNRELQISAIRTKNKKKRAAMVIIKKYICNWMAWCGFLKLLSTATFIQYCWRQVHIRKEL
jgi:folate-dependent phosphoribosylglycinamide formyltransferase PurN